LDKPAVRAWIKALKTTKRSHGHTYLLESNKKGKLLHSSLHILCLVYEQLTGEKLDRKRREMRLSWGEERVYWEIEGELFVPKRISKWIGLPLSEVSYLEVVQRHSFKQVAKYLEARVNAN